MKQFEIGKTYETHSICDTNCIIRIEVIARTAQTITVKEVDEVKRLRIIKKASECRKAETVMPWGQYSMAPMISAE